MKLVLFLFINIYSIYGYESSQKIDGPPKLLIISLDGFRHEYLTRFPHLELSNFQRFLSRGVSADGMIPVFPSVTQVNHQSIVTGLYPESHGIVSNSFYDPVLKDHFHPYKHPEQMSDPKWYSTGVTPIWVTNNLDHLQNRSTGVYCWPNSESTYNGHSVDPRFYVHVTESDKLDFKSAISKALGWYRHPTNPVNLVLFYYPSLDTVGHLTGTNSSELHNELKTIDFHLGYFLDQIEADPILRDDLNIIIVSDHGMHDLLYTPEFDNIVLLNRVLNGTSYSYNASNKVVFALTPHDSSSFPTPEELQTLISNAYPTAPVRVMTKADLAERYNYGHPWARNTHRIPPLHLLPDPGWMVFTNKKAVLKKLAMVNTQHKLDALNLSPSSDLGPFLDRVSEHYAKQEKKAGKDEEWVPFGEKHMFGVHGYGTEHVSMHALFMARGPAFRVDYVHPEPVRTIDLYELFAHVLDLQPVANNGTLEAWRDFLSESRSLPASEEAHLFGEFSANDDDESVSGEDEDWA